VLAQTKIRHCKKSISIFVNKRTVLNSNFEREIKSSVCSKNHVEC